MPPHPPQVLAIIANANTPYRLAFHTRVARELPGAKLISIFTHEVSNSPWVIHAPPEINAKYFGGGEASDNAEKNYLREWSKGGEIIDYLHEQGVTAAVVYGYNDLGRLRIIRSLKKSGIPCFLWADSNAASDHAKGLKRRLKQAYISYLLNQLSGVMVCGSLGRDYFASYGADQSRIFYVPYEPDYELIRNLPEETIKSVAAKFDLAQGRRRIVYSGRFVSVKRVDLLITAFIKLAPSRPEWDLILVGDGPLAPDFKAMVPPELSQRIRFLGFQGDQAAVSAIYRTSDVLCLPSDYEPWALVINEAAAAGLAIVSSNVVGASAEILRDEVNGKFFPSGNLQGLFHALSFVTDAANIGYLRSQSPKMLEAWRASGDPVQGLVAALQSAGCPIEMRADQQSIPTTNQALATGSR